MTRCPTVFESSVWRDAERAGRDGDRDHARRPGRRAASCPARGSPCRARRASRNGETIPSAGREQDQAEDRREPPPVGPEEREQPAAVELRGRSACSAAPARPGAQASLGEALQKADEAARAPPGRAARAAPARLPRRPACALAAGGCRRAVSPTRWRRRSRGVAGAHDQAVGLEGVEQADEVARVDPQRPAQSLLGERARVAQVCRTANSCVRIPSVSERVAEPVARSPGQPDRQERASRQWPASGAVLWSRSSRSSPVAMIAENSCLQTIGILSSIYRYTYRNVASKWKEATWKHCFSSRSTTPSSSPA